jgi:NADH:ubiquinone reductase (H+-translocating)
MSPKKEIVVIGGGFAGIQFIENIDTDIYNVTLIDKLNHHQFQPLFYQVATSQLEPSSISFPFRKIFQYKKSLQIRMAEVLRIETSSNTVVTTIGNFIYDELVIATGCGNNFFGNAEIQNNALTLKSTAEAIDVRNHILRNFEDVISVSKSEIESLMNLVIVGGGPTGVELAGAFAEIKRNILPKDYPGIDFSKLNIILVEGSKTTLSSMSENAQKASVAYITEMGVTLRTELFVKNYDGTIVTLSNGEIIKTKNLIWAAGVTGNFIEGIDKEVLAKGNRIKVDRFNLVQNTHNIYALGDIAFMVTPKYPNGHPQLANVAINQAKNLAKNFKLKATNKTLKEFEYKDLGSMATIGKHKAVVDLSFYKFSGYIAWFIWMFLHLMLILSVKNKIIIFINWAWNYFTKDTSLRLIFSTKNK